MAERTAGGHAALLPGSQLLTAVRTAAKAAQAAKAAKAQAAKAAKAQAAKAAKAKAAEAAKAKAVKAGFGWLTKRQLRGFNAQQLHAFLSLNSEAQRNFKKSGGNNLARWRHTFDNKQIGGSGGGGGGGTKRPSTEGSGKGSDERGKKRKT